MYSGIDLPLKPLMGGRGLATRLGAEEINGISVNEIPVHRPRLIHFNQSEMASGLIEDTNEFLDIAHDGGSALVPSDAVYRLPGPTDLQQSMGLTGDRQCIENVTSSPGVDTPCHTLPRAFHGIVWPVRGVAGR